MTEESHEINVYLTGPQFAKYRKGKSFQLSHSQLEADHGKHKVDIHLGKKAYRKLLNAVKNKKGFRFTDKNIVGGSLWDSIKKGASFITNNINKDDLKTIANAGINAVVPDQYKDIAKAGVNTGVDVGYALNGSGLKFKKGSEEAKAHMAKIRAMRKTKKSGCGILDDIQGAISGLGIRDNVPTFQRPIKGSAEAKERMAKIRAMRKMKGKGIFGDILHAGLPIVGHIAGETLGGPAGGVVGEALGNIGANVITKTTGVGLKNTTHVPYLQLVDGLPKPVSKKMVGGSFLQLGGALQ